MPSTLDSSGPHRAALLTPQTFGRPANLLVLASRDAAVAIGKQLAGEGISSRWRLHVAHTPAVAMQRMAETNFDLVLVDLSIDDVRARANAVVAAAGATLVYGVYDDEHGDVAIAARRNGIADVLSTQHLQGPSALRLMRLMLEGARAASNSRLLAAAVEGAPVAYAIVDALQPDMPLVYVNDYFVELTGYQPAEVIGRNCRFLQGPDTDSRDVDRIRDAIARKQPLYLELVNYRKDGQPFWNGMLLRPIRAANGTVTHFVATLRDTSDRRQTLESLERSARLHRLLVEASGGMTLFAGPDGQMRAPLPEFEHYTGMRYEEYRTGNWGPVIHPDDRDQYLVTRENALAASKPSTASFRLWHAPSGSWRFVELRWLPLFDAQQKTTEWIGTLTDVHDRLSAEHAQQQDRNFLAGALDVLPQLLIYVDRDGVVRWLNRACARWLDVRADDLVGQPLLKFADATDRELLPRRMQAALNGQAQRYTERVTLRNRSATLDVSFIPYRPDTPANGIARLIEGFFWIGTDPVEQQRLLDDTQRWRLGGLAQLARSQIDEAL